MLNINVEVSLHIQNLGLNRTSIVKVIYYDILHSDFLIQLEIGDIFDFMEL